MKWFRRTLCESRIFILAFLAVELFYLVDGRNYVYAHQVYEQKEARLKEMSELLGIPVEKLRPDHVSLFDSLKKLFGEEKDPVKKAGLKRLREVLKKQEEELAANPYLPQIEAVKRRHAVDRIEGVLNDLMQLTEPRDGTALPEVSQRALLRNLHHALQEDLTLPVPEGLPAKAQAKLSALQAKLDRSFESLRPVVAETQNADMTGTLAQKIGELRLTQTVETKRSVRGPRFLDRPLPLRRVEKKARVQEVGAEVDAKVGPPNPAISEPSPPGIPSKAGIAPEITELAQSLGNSPAKIFAWVHDHIDFDPKWGAYKGPVGTLWERSGTSWDQAWLLRDLLTAAGVDARFEWGEVEISTQLLTNIAGLDDPFRAGDLMTTAGLPIVLLTEGSLVVRARMPHVWLQAFVDYVPNRGATPGPGDKWIRMDPSLKRYSYATGIPIHEDVAFSLGAYLASATPLSPRRFYEDALWDFIRANDIRCKTLEQLKPEGAIIRESFPFLPGSLRAKILRVDGETADVPPASFQQQVTVDLRTATGGSLLSWQAPLPSLYGQRVEIDYVGATADDQAVLDSFGGVFETPPYLVDLKPVLRLDGVEAASGAAIGAAEETEIFVTFTPANGPQDVVVHEGFAGEPNVLVTDFGSLPQPVLDRFQAAVLAAAASGDISLEEQTTLLLIGATYLADIGRDLRDVAGWNWHRLVNLGIEGLVTRTANVGTAVDGSPISFTRAETFVDFAQMLLGLFHVSGQDDLSKPVLELAGAQGSFLEGLVFDEVLQEEGIAAVSALNRAQRQGQTLVRVDPSNLDAALSSADLGTDAESQIRAAVGNGDVAWITEQPITVNRWSGTGYVLENPETGAAAYLISGNYAGGSGTGGIFEAVAEILGDEAWLDSDFMQFVLSILGVNNGEGDDPGTNHGDPINLATGNLWRTEPDLIIQSRGFPIVWSRTYNSRSSFSGPFGFGWTFTYGESLEERFDGSVVYREADGTEHFFQLVDGSFTSPPGKSLVLTKTPAGFVLRATNGRETSFDLAGRLSSLSDPNGNLVSLTYDAEGNLASVVDAAGRVVLTVTVAGGLIRQITDLTGRTVLYGYSGDDLVAVTDPVGKVWEFAYDGDHNLLAANDPLGNTNSYQYDQRDRCYQHIDPAGFAERFEYGRPGREAIVTDKRGITSYFEFDDQGRAVRRVDGFGNTSESTWDSDNNRVTTIDPRGGLTARTFDDRGNVLTETDASGRTTTYTYDPLHNGLLTTTDPTGHTVTQTYDSAGNVLENRQVVNGVAIVKTFTYDGFGQLVEQSDGNGNTSLFERDPITGVVVSQTDPAGHTTTMTVDALGRVETLSDPGGNTISIAWDDKDRIKTAIDPSGTTTLFEYDDAGRRRAVEGPDGRRVTELDLLGRPLRVIDVEGNAQRFQYDPEGNVVEHTDAQGNTTRTEFDVLGRELARIDSRGQVWTFTYCGEIATTCTTCSGGISTAVLNDFCTLIDPDGNVTRQEFDAEGRVVRRVDPLGNVTQTGYDSIGRKTSEIDALNRETRFEYDALGRMTAVVEPTGGRTEYTYDANGNVTNVKDANGGDWSRTYDELDRVRTVSDPLGNTTELTYDGIGNLVSKLTPNGDRITYDYENRWLSKINLPDGSIQFFGYDARGRLTSLQNNEISVSYRFDALSRPIEMTNHTLGASVLYEYDENGRRSKVVGPRGEIVYLRDSEGRLVEMQDPVLGTFRFQYDDVGRRSRLSYPSGVVSEYLYDASGRVGAVTVRNRAGDVIDGTSYTYDAMGNRLTRSDLRTGITHLYQYDEVDRLVRWDGGPGRFEAYTYDLVGNRLTMDDQSGTTAYTYDMANRVLSQVRTPAAGAPLTTAYSWDDDGNLLSKTAGSSVTTYTWDALDRLKAVDGPGGQRSYGYDPTGIRVRETDGSGTKRLLYTFEDILAQFDDGGSLVEYFAHGTGLDEPLGRANADGLIYLHMDGIGSITSVSDEEGRVAGTASYAPFGTIDESAGERSRYTFAGRELDPTGLMYYRARYYDPGVGRFISKDKFPGIPSRPQSQNCKAYAGNNPVRFVDPSGRNYAEAIRSAAQLLALFLLWLGTISLSELLAMLAIIILIIIAVFLLVKALICLFNSQCRRNVKCGILAFVFGLRCGSYVSMAGRIPIPDPFNSFPTFLDFSERCKEACYPQVAAWHAACKKGQNYEIPWDEIFAICFGGGGPYDDGGGGEVIDGPWQRVIEELEKAA